MSDPVVLYCRICLRHHEQWRRHQQNIYTRGSNQ